MSSPVCQVDLRREAVRDAAGWVGLDYVEVDNTQTILTAVFLGKAPKVLTKDNFGIAGGRTPKDAVRVTSIDVRRSEASYLDDRVLIYVDKPGDFSTYTLSLANLDKVDPRYSSVGFSFKANCPTDLDCAPSCGCEPEVYDKPPIDYLAKDYEGFRQLILDRLSLVCPDWRERHVPDIGIALVEVLAYTGDYLSYYQDAVATEAYISTARRRPSVRRHARLVDYTLSEGCNARALIALETQNDVHFAATDVRFITGVNHLIPVGSRAALVAREIQSLQASAYEVFEPVVTQPEIYIWKANNSLSFYTWGGRQCCLPKGAMQGTLKGQLAAASPVTAPASAAVSPVAAPASAAVSPVTAPAGASVPVIHLQAGDLLIFEEVMGPVTGQPNDADPNHRQAVRLTQVTQSHDDLLNQPVVEIAWAEEDALVFELCISAIGMAPACQYLEDITIARGNVVLVDHGRPTGPEDLGTVPVLTSKQCCECEGEPSDPTVSPGRYRPQLQSGPLTFAAPIDSSAPAAEIFLPDVGAALPVLTLTSVDGDWVSRSDLLSSYSNDPHFVVEMEENGIANIRFGDGQLGRQPIAGADFTASYRVGNGTAGNVGAAAISLLIHNSSDLSNDITHVWNPLPAAGGTAPEPMAEAKLNAPYAFRYGAQALQRAITADDYATLAERSPKIQRAAAQLVWIGSWYEAEVGVDVLAAWSAEISTIDWQIEDYLRPYRRIGHDIDVRPAEYVPLDVAIKVCIAPTYLQGHVKAALLDAFSDRVLPGGKLGFFHPDNLTFGTDIYVSALIATAQALPGVVSVQVTRLQQQFAAANGELENGILSLGPFRIAQLENDPNYPDRGVLKITVVGGR